MQAVCARSLTSCPLLIAFLKHSCSLSSGKGDPPLKRKWISLEKLLSLLISITSFEEMFEKP